MEMFDLIITEVRQVGAKLDALTQKVDNGLERTTVVETQIEPLFDNGQPGEISKLKGEVEGLKTRMSAQENWRHWVMGITAAVGAILGGVATWLGLKSS